MNNPIRILLVDDSPYFLEAAREFLTLHEAFTVVDVASEEQEALAKSLMDKPDVILLDLNLAHRSGLELIPLFRKQLPRVKIIVLTMMQEAGYRAAAMQAGANAFVRKAAITKSLVSTIIEVMNPASHGMKGTRKKAIKKSGAKGSRSTSNPGKHKKKIRIHKERIA